MDRRNGVVEDAEVRRGLRFGERNLLVPGLERVVHRLTGRDSPHESHLFDRA